MCQGGAEGGVDGRLVALHLGRILQPPMRFEGGAEVHRAGFTGGLVADGDDDVRRVVGKRLVAFAGQAGSGDTGLL
ncbi:hypothetical protein D3C76_1756300 [compost metagenome]